MNERKILVTVASLVGFVALAAFALFVWSHQASAANETSETVTAVLNVAGMTCGGCELAVRTALKKLDGVAPKVPPRLFEHFARHIHAGEVRLGEHPQHVTAATPDLENPVGGTG